MSGDIYDDDEYITQGVDHADPVRVRDHLLARAAEYIAMTPHESDCNRDLGRPNCKCMFTNEWADWLADYEKLKGYP